MNRGSKRIGTPGACASSRFNEAPIHESGKYGLQLLLPIGIPGFNEAPIHESGKLGLPGAVEPAAVGFNEAPIHESGKSHWTIPLP